MQYFKDSKTGEVYAYETDVTVHTDANGTTTVYMSNGTQLKNAPTTLVSYDPSVLTPAEELSNAQSSKINSIAASFRAAIRANVVDPKNPSNIWSGGLNSAYSINGAIQLAQYSGKTTVDIWDAGNTMHTLTIAEAQNVVALIGDAYQTAYQNWQNKRLAVNNATTVSAVNAITW